MTDNIPQGCKLLRAEANKGGFLCVFGIYRTMQDFVEVAKILWHPFDELKNLPDNLICAIFDNLTMSPYQLAKKRCSFMSKWTTRAKELKQQEDSLHLKMPPHVRAVLAGKRILLMQEMAEAISWPDRRVFDELQSGFKLVGTMDRTEIFKPHPNLAMMSERELENSMKFLKPAILGKLNQVSDTDMQKELLKITDEEAGEKQ